MQKLFFSCFLVFFLMIQSIWGQDIVTYKDSVYHFSIGMPISWKYVTVKNSTVKLLVYTDVKTDSMKFSPNYNVNLIPFPNSNIDSAFASLYREISTREGFEIVSKGDTIIEGKKYMWLKEHHFNIQNGMPMTALVYLGYHNGMGYMVTYSLDKTSFDRVEPLYKVLSYTLRL